MTITVYVVYNEHSEQVYEVSSKFEAKRLAKQLNGYYIIKTRSFYE